MGTELLVAVDVSSLVVDVSWPVGVYIAVGVPKVGVSWMDVYWVGVSVVDILLVVVSMIIEVSVDAVVKATIVFDAVDVSIT